MGEARLLEVSDATRQLLAEHGEAVDGNVLRARVLAGEVIRVDVRPSEEYRAGHLPDAPSVPLPELAARLAEFPAIIPRIRPHPPSRC